MHRIISTIFGIFFIALAVFIIATADPSTRAAAIVAAIFIGGLGIDLIGSVIRGRRSLLSRIGPLP